MRCQEEPEICIDTETTSLVPLLARLVGIGLGFPSSPDCAWYIPLGGSLGRERVLAGLKPILEDIKKQYAGKINIVEIDIDQNKSLADDMNIRNIPLLIYHKKGKVEMNIEGFVEKADLIKTLKL